MKSKLALNEWDWNRTREPIKAGIKHIIREILIGELQFDSGPQNRQSIAESKGLSFKTPALGLE